VPTATPGTTPRLWKNGTIPPAPAATPADSAIALVGRLAPAWGAPHGTAALEPIATTSIDGGDLVRLRQLVDGVEIDGGELRVLVGPGGSLIAASGVVADSDLARDRDGFRLDAAAAVVGAVRDVHGVDLSAGLHARVGPDAAWFDGAAGGVTLDRARARQRWYRDGEALVPAWVVETFSTRDDDTAGSAMRTVIAARDGRVLARRDLVADAFSYRVWAEPDGDLRPLDGPTEDFTPHPTGFPGGVRPAFIDPTLIAVDGLDALADPWLADDATVSSGNNVDAYTDVNAPDGLSDGDIRASVTTPGIFDRTYDVAASPLGSAGQQQAAVTQLFYDINWLHDDWYDAGFTEANGNGQVDNYGRGGIAGDPVLAEAQDDALGFGRNNANLATPDDGMSPRMQVYLWDGPAGVDADGTLDGGLVAHEFGHYVHHRLCVCDTQMCAAMSEGWGDFIALLTIARPGDDLTGTFAQIGYAYAGDPYFGLRRVPYSVDTTKNAFTFRMVAAGEPLPTTHPIQLNGGDNAEVHNAGEIWAESLWEAYVALQQAHGAASFAETRRTMQRYVVDGLSMAPPNASFTETRDAILAVVDAASPADHDVMAAAFARRGLGSCAVSPDRDSSDFVGAVESFEVDGHALAGATTVAIDVEDCDDDGVLDVGETATITVPVVNAGAEPLSDVTVTAAAHTTGLTVVTEPVALGGLTPYQAATASFQVRLDAATAPTEGLVTITIASPGGCDETVDVTVPLRLATDDALEASASDSFDASTSAWTPSGDDAPVAWRHTTPTPLDGEWHGDDLGTTSDTALVSPPLVAGSGPVTVRFEQAFWFEASDQFYDGGVIEISIDGGSNWSDISAVGPRPYNGTLSGGTGNVLAGREGFVGTSSAYPNRAPIVLEFGTALAGITFQLRFRIATDVGVGAPGWSIDDLEVEGITNTPFPALVDDDNACDLPQPEDGGCCSTGGSHGSDVAAGLLVVALVLRRRRR
jgi:hypothetical protein